MEVLYSIIGILIFIMLSFVLLLTSKGLTIKGKEILKFSFTVRVIIALVLGVIFGTCIQLIFPHTTEVDEVKYISGTAGYYIQQFLNLIGSAFSNALLFTVVPIVLISIIRSITKMYGVKNGLAKTIRILGSLLITAAIASIVAIIVVKIFSDILPLNILESPTDNEYTVNSIVDVVLSFFPKNIFAAISSGSALPVVFVALIIGIAYLQIKKHNQKITNKFDSALEVSYTFSMQILDIVLTLTPYGVLALMANQLASGSLSSLAFLGIFILVTFVALIVMFLIHLIIVAIMGISPIRYLKKAGPALMFAFSSRSSAATLPLTIQTQTKLGVPEINATIAGSLGLTIGQNGCVGVYPTIVAILVGIMQGIDVWSFSFLVPLVIYVIIASLGSGGGATNGTLMTLALLGLPVNYVVILYSVDFIIDMGRTLLNVNDSILTGIITSKLERNINKDLLYDKITYEEYINSQTEKPITPEEPTTPQPQTIIE